MIAIFAVLPSCHDKAHGKLVSIDFLEKSLAAFVQNRKCQGVNHIASEFTSFTSLAKERTSQVANCGTQISFFGWCEVDENWFLCPGR